MVKESVSRLVRVRQHRTISVFRSGVKATRECEYVAKLPDSQSSKRGRITGFSKASRRRLRDLILRTSAYGFWRFGLCLTLPGELVENETDVFKRIVNRFQTKFHRAFSSSFMICRVELQSRGAPHLHALVFLRDDGDSRFSDWVGVAELWRSAVYCDWRFSSESSFRAFENHGVKFTDFKSKSAAIRYLVDDMSKHKQAQLGYKGKQWFVVNRRNLALESASDVLRDRQAVVVARVFGKLRRYWIDDSRCVFGRRLSKFHSCDSGISFAGEKTVQRIIEWVKGLNKPLSGAGDEVPSISREF